MNDIIYINRASGKKEFELIASSGMLKWLYDKPIGKIALHLLAKRKFVSSFVGCFMDTKWSKAQIKRFVNNCNLDLSDYKITDYKDFKTFNDFFHREINPLKRPIGKGIVSPADGRLLAFQSINEIHSFFVKGSEFTLDSFLHDKELELKYKDGAIVIARLAPTDYHRFHFPADGIISRSKLINGKYFSVSPIALKKSLEIFCQNKREYSTIRTTNNGDVLVSEIGATMVGSIIQTYEENTQIKRGSKKGYFAFGGSTIIILFEKDKVKLAEDLLANTTIGLETLVKIGEQIGV